MAGMVAPLLLCVSASWVALLPAYRRLYGAAPWALQAFARVLGGVIEPIAACVWTLKTIAFGAALLLLPIAAATTPPRGQRVDPIDLRLTTQVRTSVLLVIKPIALLAVCA